MLKKEITKTRNTSLEMIAIVVGLATLLAWLMTGCGAPEVQTRSEACHEQAEVYCEQIGHPNASCETGYYYRCTPAGTDREAPMDADYQTRCLESIVQHNTPNKDGVPAVCQMFWRQL